MERHRLADVRRDVVEVGAVPLGEDDVGQAGRVRGEHLLLQAADREDAALERDLAGHADRVPHRPAGEERRERGRHRDAGARAVLRDRARRDVHVERALVERVGLDLELLRVRADVGERDLRGLLHHVAELAGQRQPLVALHAGRLDEEDVAAGARDGEPGGDARDRRPLGGLLAEALPAERVAEKPSSTSTGASTRPAAIFVAVLRSSLPSSRSSWRTPASRVYSLTTRSSSSSDIVDLVLEQAVALALPRPEVAARDRDLLVDRVAVEADDLHPVEQRAGDRLGDVRGGDEDDLGEVELDVEVVVAERVVLRRVEHLEQRRRRVAAPVGADLVDLVEHDHRVHRPGVAQRPHEAAGQRADVRAPVAADLGLVADAAERHADELAVERARDRLADRRLAGAGRPDQRQDRAGALVLLDPALLAQLAHGEVLDDAVLDVVEAVVVGVEDLARVRSGRGAPRSACPTAPRPASRGRCGSSRTPGDCSPMRSSRSSSRSACSRTASGMPASSIFVRYSSTTEPSSSPSSLRIDSICLRRMYSRCCFCAPDSTSSRMRRAHLQLGEPLALEAQRQLEPLDDVERLEELDLLLEGEVRASSRRCRRARPAR